MFWIKKKETDSRAFKEALRMLEIIEAKVNKMGMEIEILQLKGKKKIFKKELEEQEDPDKEGNFKYNDGFDRLRQLHKESGIS